jgi:hypothetical protein
MSLINVTLKMNQTKNVLTRFCLGLPYRVRLILVRQFWGLLLADRWTDMMKLTFGFETHLAKGMFLV